MKKAMKLSDWAREHGIDYKTAYRLYRSNKFPRPTEQLATGTILVYEEEHPIGDSVVLYARVSSHDQKESLEHQLERLRLFAISNGYKIHQEIKEIGSGLNGHRKKLLKVLEDPNISTIIVEHKDRLARFGADYIIAALNATNRKVVIVNETECKDDLVQDMIDVLTSFCARLYGKRSAKARAKRALEACEDAN